MRRPCSAALAFLVAAAWDSGASAQEDDQAQGAGLGAAGHVALSVERMFGYVHTTRTSPGVMQQSETTFDTISLLGGTLTGVISPYTYPRLAADLFLTPNLTAGASLSYSRTSTSSAGGSTSTISGFTVAPRVGFSFDASPKVSIWGRAGITYGRFSSDSVGQSSTISFLALTLEAPLAFSAAPGVWLTVGPIFDLGLTGSESSSAGTTSSTKNTDVGVQAGLIVVL